MKAKTNKCNKCLEIVIKKHRFFGTVFMFALLSKMLRASPPHNGYPT